MGRDGKADRGPPAGEISMVSLQVAEMSSLCLTGGDGDWGRDAASEAPTHTASVLGTPTPKPPDLSPAVKVILPPRPLPSSLVRVSSRVLATCGRDRTCWS